MQVFLSSFANLASCCEEVSSCLVSAQWNLDRLAVRHADARERVRGRLDAVPRPVLRGRHGVDVGEHVQPL